MSSSWAAIACCLVGAATVSACGDGEAPPEPRDPTTIVVPQILTEPDFAALVVEIGCHAVAPCCANVGYTYDRVACGASFSSAFGFSPRPGLSFDNDFALQCLKALQKGAIACDGLPAVCRKVYRGNVAPGGSCSSDEQCGASGDQKVTCDTLRDGTCKLRLDGELGQPCDQTCEADTERYPSCADTFPDHNVALPPDTHVACDRARGLYCDALSATCEPLFDVGAACTDSTHCSVGSWCVGHEDAASICQPLVAEGQPCTLTYECAGDAYCDANGTCHAPRTKADGESCSTSIECAGQCDEGRCAGAVFAGGFSRYIAEAICSHPGGGL